MTRTLSRFYPADHARKGDRTHFVEKLYEVLYDKKITVMDYYDKLFKLNPNLSNETIKDFWKTLDWSVREPKKHTIRMGNHIKDGQMLQLAVWGNDVNPKSGRSGPYQSQQIKIWEPVKVGVTPIHVINYDKGDFLEIRNESGIIGVNELSKNDGLAVLDFYSWFRKASGPAQIIHWTDLRY